MTRLLLIRHAKAVGDGGAAGDHGRVLAERGRTDAIRLGLRLVEAGWLPDRVLVSDAARTRETWTLAADVLARVGHEPEVRIDRALYLAAPEQIAQACRSLGAAGGCLALVGHNPGWEQLGAELCGEDLTLPTCGTLLLSTERSGSWTALLGQSGAFRLHDRLVP